MTSYFTVWCRHTHGTALSPPINALSPQFLLARRRRWWGDWPTDWVSHSILTLTTTNREVWLLLLPLSLLTAVAANKKTVKALEERSKVVHHTFKSWHRMQPWGTGMKLLKLLEDVVCGGRRSFYHSPSSRRQLCFVVHNGERGSGSEGGIWSTRR